MVILGFLSSVFFLIGPYLSSLYVDKSFLKKDLNVFLKLSVLGAALVLISALAKFSNDILKKRLAVRIKLNLSRKLIKKLFSLDMGFFRSSSIGENIYRISNIEPLADFIADQIPFLLVDISKLFIILAISLWLNLRLTVFLLALSPLFLLQSLYIRKKIRPLYNEIWSSRVKLTKLLEESLANVQIVKALGLNKWQEHVYVRQLLKNIRLGLNGFRWSVFNSLGAVFLSKGAYGLISLYGGWMIIQGKISLGTFSAAMLYIVQLGNLLQSLSYRFEYFIQQGISLDKIAQIISLDAQIRDHPGAENIISLKGKVFFQGVKFGYEKDRLVFDQFLWIAIVGPSGCGKTTLANLILRLYDPQGGKITIDGVDLKGIKLESLRNKIAIATQDPLLFDLSIRDNIVCDLNNLTEDKVQEAGRIAQMHDFIKWLPCGYDTFIGESGCQLSQGFKQRVALARAITREPDLLILDEATSSIDSATEDKILNALRLKRAGRSTVVISHRLSTIKDADLLFLFTADGKIEEGTHSELLSRSQAYREFFTSQMTEETRRDFAREF
ncbi:MAG: ABC transporter ATP-binding protein [Candidatus Omnitrophica bacterium]|nr:ABC transporter ATP-binding protein [Candidatus Omnitrophota bacterium]